MRIYTKLVSLETSEDGEYFERIFITITQGMFEQLRVEDRPLSPIIAKNHREDVRANQKAVFLSRTALIGPNGHNCMM